MNVNFFMCLFVNILHLVVAGNWQDFCNYETNFLLPQVSARDFFSVRPQAGN